MSKQFLSVIALSAIICSIGGINKAWAGQSSVLSYDCEDLSEGSCQNRDDCEWKALTKNGKAVMELTPQKGKLMPKYACVLKRIKLKN